MRQFPSVLPQKKWKKGQVSLLAGASPPHSPSTFIEAYSAPSESARDGPTDLDARHPFSSQSGEVGQQQQQQHDPHQPQPLVFKQKYMMESHSNNNNGNNNGSSSRNTVRRRSSSKAVSQTDWPVTPQSRFPSAKLQPRSRYTEPNEVSSMTRAVSVGNGLHFVPAYDEDRVDHTRFTPNTVASTPSPTSTPTSTQVPMPSSSVSPLPNPADIGPRGRSVGARRLQFDAATPARNHHSSTRSSSQPRMSQAQDDSGSTVGSAVGKSKSSRIGRLASLFSSRAVVSSKPSEVQRTPSGNSASMSNTTPEAPRGNGNGSRKQKEAPSPSRSSEASSGGYAGWPGTQMKHGGTVSVKASFEQSDVDIPGTQKMRYEDKMKEAADREVTIWMDNDQSFDDFSERDFHPSQSQRSRNNEQIGDPCADGTDQQSQPSSDHDDAVDFRLAALVADAAESTNSPTVIQPAEDPQAFVDGDHQPVQAQQQPQQQRTTAPPTMEQHINYDIYGDGQSTQELHTAHKVSSPMVDPWGTIDNLSDASPNTVYSKTSSAYFTAKDAHGIGTGVYGIADRNRLGAASVMRGLQSGREKNALQNGEHRAWNQAQRHAQAFSPSSRQPKPQPPTEEALALNDHFHPAHRTFNAINAIGYSGLLNKTQDVPNLMDDADSVSTASHATSIQSFATSHASFARSTVSVRSAMGKGNSKNRVIDYGREQQRQQQQPDTIVEQASSDVFDGVRSTATSTVQKPTAQQIKLYENLNGSARVDSSSGDNRINDESAESTLGIDSKPSENYRPQAGANPSLNVVLLGGGLTTIQTTATDFSKRITASDYDENLTNSDYDQYGFVEVPAFHTMLNDKTAHYNRTPSLLGASSLRLTDDSLRAEYSGSESGSSLFSNPYGKGGWRPMHSDLSKFYVQPDEMKKVVRMFRKLSKSRCSKLTSYERYDEDDAIKAFALAEMRSRVMEKDIERGLERRGWTAVVDDIVDTPKGKAALRVRDAVIVAKAWRDGANPADVIRSSLLTQHDSRTYYIWRGTSTPSASRSSGYWEEVRWQDDNAFSLQQCASLGSRPLRGFELFTIGDCQSMLLKLTNDHCAELREELNVATARQIDAEEKMKAEGDSGDGFMTEAEMSYLVSMETVKAVSQRLVVAETAFSFVKERIEKLISRYETILVKIENDNESMVASSVMTYESSRCSDVYSSDEEDENEVLARRAQRAELRAELAAREAMLAREEVRMVREEKERELSDLRAQLDELQSEASTAISQRQSSLLYRAINSSNSRSVAASSAGTARSKIEEVKQRFRARTRAKMVTFADGQRPGDSDSADSPYSNVRVQSTADGGSGNIQPRQKSSLAQSVGEEMFQHLDFYERSLRAVKGKPRSR